MDKAIKRKGGSCLRGHRKWLGAMIRGVLTLCLSVALCIDMRIPVPIDGQTSVERLWHITGMATRGSLVTPLFFFLLWASWRIDGQKAERRLAFPLVNGFIALIWLMAEGFRVDDTLWTLHASYIQMAKSLVYFVGITYGLSQITYFLYGALEKREPKSPGSTLTGPGTWQDRIAKAYREHTLLVSFCAVFAAWLPHLILAYPANFFWIDAFSQLAQFFGLTSYSNHHPITSTLIMGGLIRLGSLISGNFGAFLYITVQALIGAWTLAYTLHIMRELNSPVWLRVLTFGCYIVVPYYITYFGVFTKDVLYSYAVLLFVTELIYILVRNEDVFQSKRHILLLALSIAGTILLRNNGKYMLYPTVAVVLLYLFFRTRKIALASRARRRTFCSIAAAFLLPVLLAEMFSASMIYYLDATPGSFREALSLPFQQTARYVKEFGDEVTEEEKAAISAVLDYENLAEKYDPRIADPVKGAPQSKDATLEDGIRYIQVWLRQFVKHPFVYFKATVNQNYYLLYPYIANDTVVVYPILETANEEISLEVMELLGLHDVEPIASLKPLLRGLYKMGFYFPGLNLLSHPAFYMTLLIWLTLFSLCKKRLLWLLASVPVWLSAVIVVLGPVIQVHCRYAFPVIYAMPIALAYYIYLGRSKEPLEQ